MEMQRAVRRKLEGHSPRNKSAAISPKIRMRGEFFPFCWCGQWSIAKMRCSLVAQILFWRVGEFFRASFCGFAFGAEGFASKGLQGAIDNKEEMKMKRRGMSFLLTVLAALALALPIAAGSGDTNAPKAIVTMSVDLSSPATLAGTALKPGSYFVKADSAKVTLSRGDKVMAEAAVEWKDAAGKAEYSSIIKEGDRITEIHFGGKAKYVVIAR
jgi:hypothetical protein